MSAAQSSLFPRIAPPLISVLGSLGLACALTYVGAIVLSTQQGYEQISEFLIGRSDQQMSFGFLLVAIPYVLLLAHLYLRTRLGHWLVDGGWLEQAENYTSERLGPNPLIGRREVLSHRIALAKVYAWRCDYERAWEVLEGQVGQGGETPRRGPFALDWHRWRLEVALRQENNLRAHAAAEAAEGVAGQAAERARVEAAVAELAVREGDREGYDAAMRRAGWAKADAERLAWARALAARRFGAEADELKRALEGLRRARPELERELPGRRLELDVVEAALLAMAGEVASARAMLRSKAEFAAKGDPRARHVYEQSRDELDGEDDVEVGDG